MRKTWQSAGVAVVGVLALAGCQQSGLSPHETDREGTFPMLMSAAAAAPSSTTAPAGPVKLPMRVALAQVGEVAPPQSMMDALRGRPDLFRHIDPVSGVAPPVRQFTRDGYGNVTHVTADEPNESDHLTQLERTATNLGDDYLLVFGGTVDHGEQGSGLQLLDLTIVGAFVVPSHGVQVSGRSSGALIDVRSGQPRMSFSAESKGTGAAPSAFVENVETAAVAKNRDELVGKLTTDIVQQVSDLQRDPH